MTAFFDEKNFCLMSIFSVQEVSLILFPKMGAEGQLCCFILQYTVCVKFKIQHYCAQIAEVSKSNEDQMSIFFDKKNFLNSAHFRCAGTLIKPFVKIGNRMTPFLTLLSKIQYLTFWIQQCGNFKEAIGIGWYHFDKKN